MTQYTYISNQTRVSSTIDRNISRQVEMEHASLATVECETIYKRLDILRWYDIGNNLSLPMNLVPDSQHLDVQYTGPRLNIYTTLCRQMFLSLYLLNMMSDKKHFFFAIVCRG